MAEGKALGFGGSIVTLGHQYCSFSEAQLRGWASLDGVEIPGRDESGDPLALIAPARLLSLLGFSSVRVLDHSAYEGADILHDLNQPIPDELKGCFGVVLNGGTLEHIFHVPNVLANLHHLTRTGGRIIHIAPSSNQIDHGMYSFSPTFFYDYYSANKYLIRKAYLFECLDWDTPWTVYDYKPGSLDGFQGRIGGGRVLGTFFVAQKTAESTCDVIPQQGYYQSAWVAKTHPAGQPFLEGRLRTLLRQRVPGLWTAVREARRKLSLQASATRHGGPMPPRIGTF